MVHWFKRHPKYLATESVALSKDTNYKELFQLRDNLFVSHGNILVRLEKTYRFPVLIVYSEATPYVLPTIYPLKQELTKAQVESVAKGTSEQVFLAISQYIEYYYHLRHQNQSGSLCILEWDNLDEGSKFYGITTILKRLRDWFKGTITGEFPPDSQEIEFHTHFNNIASDLKLLYPRNFLDDRLLEGEAYSLRFSYISKGLYYTHDRKAFLGCLLTGKSKSGLYEQVNYDLPYLFYEEAINNAIELIEKKDALKRLINEGRLLRSPWFQLQHEPPPFQTFEKLIELIGNGNSEEASKRMLPYFKDEQIEKPASFSISVRFTNRKGKQEFQLFNVLKKAEATGVLLGVPNEEAFRHFLSSYEIVQAIPCEEFSDETYHLRNTGRAERNLLKEKTVNIVGVGALGSEIADILAKAGAGTICLFDNQVMRGPNPVRHLAGLEQIGVAKVVAVGRILADHNPFIHVHLCVSNINEIELNNYFSDDSITISSIAEDNTEAFLNERAVIAHKVVYYARALRGAKVARIFRVIPGKDACFHCLELYRAERQVIIDIPVDDDLPTLKNECNNPVRPASAADLKLISAITSRILLDELQKGFGENNHWIWSSEEVEGLHPFQLQAQSIPPHLGCYYCNHEKKVRVLLSQGILKLMQAMVAENPHIETGGVLAGYTNETGDLVITHASGPGPKAVKSATRFEKDLSYCQEFLDELFASSNKQIAYVGEWHSHPSLRNQPSGTDINSLTNISYQKEYLTDKPVMIIFSNTGIPSCTIHPAGKTYYFTSLIETE